MRSQWRLLRLLRCHARSQLDISIRVSNSQVKSIHSVYSSPLYPRTLPLYPQTPTLRCFSSSELAVEDKVSADQAVVLNDIFSKLDRSNDEIKLDLESSNVLISHDLILTALRNLNTAPDVARRFFNWVVDCESERLSSKSYNLMLGILGANGFVKEFWDMVGIMKKKGYGVSKGIFSKVLERFGKDGLSSDIDRLKELYASGSTDNSVEKVCSRVCKVVRQGVWDDEMEKQLRELNIEFSSELVAMIVENLQGETNKGLIFFRWVEETGLTKHDERTYNAMVRVLGREDSAEKFRKVIGEMRNAGYEIERVTYISVIENFIKRKMIKDAVDLYEFAMGSVNKPSKEDCTFLLKKIVVSKELDVDLFSKVMKIFREGGNELTNATLKAVLKSLTSVGRTGECNKIVKAAEDVDFLPNDALQSRIAFQLSSAGKVEEADQFINNMEASGRPLHYETWASLIKGYIVAGDLSKASDVFENMVEKLGNPHAGFALELLVTGYCRKKKVLDAYKLVSKMSKKEGLRPRHSMYKILISKMLAQKNFEEAVQVLGLMMNQGYPPFVDPFMEYLSKSGNADNAIAFCKGMTTKRFPSTSVFLRLFEVFFEAGRHNEAQDFLLKCPKYIRNHADVLNLFCSMKPEDSAVATAMAT